MGRILYGGNRLIPCPLIDFTRVYNRTDDGEKIGSTWNITINGKAVAFKGSPSSSGVWHNLPGYPSDEVVEEDSRLSVLLRKEEYIREAFNQDGLLLEVYGDDGTAPIKCSPIVREINFTRDIWVNYIEYTISLEASVLSIEGLPDGEDPVPYYIESSSETWNLETDDSQAESLDTPRTYRLTHSISAKGKRFYDETGLLVKPAWQQAREFVLPRLGFDSSILQSSGVADAPAYLQGLNHIRSETIEELGGSYSVTENWVLASGNALETFDVSIKKSADTGLTNVTIDGNITGLEVRNPNTMAVTSLKYTNANAKFTTASGLALSRAQQYSDTTLNIQPLSTSVGKSVVAGTIQYSFEYDNRPSNLIPTSLSETISINDGLQTDVVAIIPIPGRTAGPILQDVNTSREKRRTLDIEAVFPVQTGTIQQLLTKPTSNPVTASAIQAIIDAADPVNSLGASVSYLDDNNERLDVRGNRFSLTKTWIYET